MKVVKTTDSTHTIRFIPRAYVLIATTLEITNESNKEVTALEHIIAGTEGILSLIFDYNFSEGDRFQLKLYDSTDVIYRGRILATDQDKQEYDTTTGYYEYE